MDELTFRAQEPNGVETMKGTFDPNLMAEVMQVGATPHGDMLTIVYKLVDGRVIKRACSPSQSRSTFQQKDFEISFDQLTRGGKAGQSSPDDHDPRS